MAFPAGNYLFDRSAGNPVWLASLADFERDGDPTHAAVAQNWRMDGRVDRQRETQLCASSHFPSGRSGSGFQSALREYFLHRLCRSPSADPGPEYASPANQGNLIADADRPLRNHPLIHLASLNRLLGLIFQGLPGKAGLQRKWYELTGYRAVSDINPASIDRLIEALRQRGLDGVRAFVGALSDALGQTEPHWWAAFAYEIGDMAPWGNWTSAIAKTGQGHLRQGEWLLAWRYPPDIVGRLYRPTVAEAGDNAFHFPSPPNASYGVAMPLVPGAPAIREVIHPPLKGDTCMEACIGIGRIEDEPAPDSGAGGWLATRRSDHARALAAQFSPAQSAGLWLQRHGLP